MKNIWELQNKLEAHYNDLVANVKGKNCCRDCIKVHGELGDSLRKFVSEYARMFNKYSTLMEERDALKKEVKRLAAQITNMATKATGCTAGPWCEDCAHRGVESAPYRTYYDMEDFAKRHNTVYQIAESGTVWYCKKHIHDICPGFDIKVVERFESDTLYQTELS